MLIATDVLLVISLVVLTSLIIYTRGHRNYSKTHKYVYVLFCMLLFNHIAIGKDCTDCFGILDFSCINHVAQLLQGVYFYID